MNIWDERFLRLAREVASWSKDNSTKVGAVITDDKKRVISLGFNGFPRGVADDDRLENRETKYAIIVHAEMNALTFAHRNLANCTLYCWPFMPCSRCAGPIIQSGISRIVAPATDNPRWVADFEISRSLFREVGIDLEEVSSSIQTKNDT